MVENVQNRIKILPAVQPVPHAPIPLAQLQAYARLSGRLPALANLTLHTSDHDGNAKKCAVVFLQSAYKKVVDHLARDTTREHGGFLLGYESALESGVPAVVITDAVAARRTEGTPIRLTFTTDTWRDFEDEILRRYLDQERVPLRLGWYHSHPNISIFLSQYDLDVCTTFQRRRYPVALVVDPVQNLGGFFIGEGKGYCAHSPQGFYEAHDEVQESLVTWRNLRRADGVSTPAETNPPIRKAENGFTIVPHTQESSRPNRTRQAAVGMVLAAMTVAIGYLFVKERRDARNIQALSTVVSSLKPGPAAGPVAPQTSSPTLTITPPQAELSASQQMQFHAELTGTADNGIGWERTPKLGTISSAGLYTAPKQIKSETKVTVTARSAADPSIFAIAPVGLVPAKSIVSLKVTPKIIQLKPLQKQRFKARVSGVTNDEDQGVEWKVDPKEQGTVTKDGLYTAPPAIPSKTTVTVTATSLADSKKSASSTISLIPAPEPASHAADGGSPATGTPKQSTPVSPSSTSLSSTPAGSPPTPGPLEIKADKTVISEGESVTLTATVAGKADSEVRWGIEPADLGSISQDGRYTAPNPVQQERSKITVIATSKKDPSRTARQVLTLKKTDKATSDAVQ